MNRELLLVMVSGVVLAGIFVGAMVFGVAFASPHELILLLVRDVRLLSV